MEPAPFISQRAGKVIKQSSGYRAFSVNPLPPNPPPQLDAEMIQLLSEADRMLGRLNGMASIISDSDLFVYLFVRKEALLSSQIEGTQCSLEDILVEDSDAHHGNKNHSEIGPLANHFSLMRLGCTR